MRINFLRTFLLCISLFHGIALKSAQLAEPYEICELNRADSAEIMQTGSIFDVSDICRATVMNSDKFMECVNEGESYKIFIGKTTAERPMVVGVLICQYLVQGQFSRISRKVDWNDGIKRKDKKGDAVEITTLGVHPNYRKQGIATQLMQMTQDVSVAHGVACLNLSVYLTSQKAILLYKKLGFDVPSKTHEDAIFLRLHKILP